MSYIKIARITLGLSFFCFTAGAVEVEQEQHKDSVDNAEVSHREIEQFINGLKKRVDNYSFEEFKKFLHTLIEAADYDEMLKLLENNLESGKRDQEEAHAHFPENEKAINVLFGKAFVFAQLQVDSCRILYQELKRVRDIIQSKQQKIKIVVNRAL